MGVIMTVPKDGNSSYDAFSRFFAPLYGVNEDPVTGKKIILSHHRAYRTNYSFDTDFLLISFYLYIREKRKTEDSQFLLF